MPDFRGNLLIGGMTLKNLVGTLDQENCCQNAKWCGELIIDLNSNEHLELNRPYRLELDDGRAGKIVIRRVDCVVGQRKLRVAFDGLSSLERKVPVPLPAQPADQPARVAFESV